jgi:hypothetical protein
VCSYWLGVSRRACKIGACGVEQSLVLVVVPALPAVVDVVPPPPLAPPLAMPEGPPWLPPKTPVQADSDRQSDESSQLRGPCIER